MKQSTIFQPTLFFCLTFSMMVFSIGCSQKKEKNETTMSEVKASSDTIKSENPKSNPVSSSQTAGSTPTETAQAPTKKCDPNFNLIASPKKNQKIYYVSGFNPGEFKCWEELEKESQKICAGSPCVIYFLDKPNPKITTTPPHYLDTNTLMTNGIGLYEYNGVEWEMKGSNIWGRKDKGFAYYNTNNAGGG